MKMKKIEIPIVLPLLVSLNSKSKKIVFDSDIGSEHFKKVKENSIDCWTICTSLQFAEIQKCIRIYLKANLLTSISSVGDKKLERGQQVIYVPSHLRYNADIENPDIQFGFVTSEKNNTVFCRYFGYPDFSTLRTLSCSESCNKKDLYILEVFDQNIVNLWLKYIKEQDDTFTLPYEYLRTMR